MKNRNKKDKFLRVICRGILMLTVASAVFISQNMTAQAAGDVEINEENFPDELFRNYVTEEFDTDQNGKLSEEERFAARRIWTNDIPFTSVKGVEFFPKLEYLILNGTKITEVDISQNLELTNLKITYANITSLDVSKNVMLKELSCFDLNLTELDLHNNKELTSLVCDDNPITELDLHNNKELWHLSCGKTLITELDLSENTKLVELSCDGLNLKELDLHKNPELWRLNCSHNDLMCLDVSCCPKLEKLECTGNDLTSLDVSKCPELKELKCSSNDLVSLDLSHNDKLIFLECIKNKLTSLSMKSNPEVYRLDCRYNLIEYLDVSAITKLKSLYCEGNSLEELDVSANTELQLLWCGMNPLKHMDLSKNKSLIEADFYDSRLSSLNLSGAIYLQKLDVYACRALHVVDISNNPYLLVAYKRADSRCLNYTGDNTIVTDQFENPFSDVKFDKWYDPAVRYVYLQGYMIGKETRFGVADTLTRQEFTQVLYNIAGKPEVTIENTYEDVVPGAWYEKSVLWAREAGIAKGKVDGVFFGIDQEITREEMIQMLNAFRKWHGDIVGYLSTGNDISDFPDSDKVSSWAKDSMQWAIGHGIISGKGDAGAPASEKLIDPQGHATRAECASIIMSYYAIGDKSYGGR